MPILSSLIWTTRPAAHLLRDLAETYPSHPAACLLPRLADVIELAGIENDGEALDTLITAENIKAFHSRTGTMIHLAAQCDPGALGAFLALFPDVDQVVIKNAPAAPTTAPSRKARRAALSRSAKRR